MRILVDGDACPNKEEIVKIAKEYQLEMIVFVDYAHILDDEYYEVRQCEIGRDSVDMQIVNEVQKDDIVITQDYGLSSLLLVKKTKVLHVSGMIIDKDNIDDLLMRRYQGYKDRRKDKHLKGPKKRTVQDKEYFLNQLISLIKEMLSIGGVMKKYIFFDIDGTLTNHNPGGIILPSTHKTLEKLKQNGHFVAIATGRSYTMAKEMMKEADIHNCVCCGGNGLVVNDKVIYIKPLDKTKALEIINECIDNNIGVGVMIDDSLTTYTHDKDFNQKCPEVQNFSKVQFMEQSNYIEFKEIHKIYIGVRTGEESQLHSLKTTGLHYARYHEASIIVEPDDKYSGILDMIHYIKGSEEDIVVFGDGYNDLSMMKQAPIGIAMGNAIDDLKEVASFITKDCNDDGIEYACEYYHWI